MVKLYFYTSKNDYVGILNDEVIIQPDDPVKEKGIYINSMTPKEYVKKGLHLKEFEADDRARNNHKRGGKNMDGKLARLDHYIELDIPADDFRLIQVGTFSTQMTKNKRYVYRYVGDIDFDEFEWTGGPCSEPSGDGIECDRCEDAEKQEQSESSDEELTWDHPEVQKEIRAYNRIDLEEEHGADRRKMIKLLKWGSEDCGLSLKKVFSLLDTTWDGTMLAAELR